MALRQVVKETIGVRNLYTETCLKYMFHGTTPKSGTVYSWKHLRNFSRLYKIIKHEERGTLGTYKCTEVLNRKLHRSFPSRSDADEEIEEDTGEMRSITWAKFPEIIPLKIIFI